MTLPQKHYVALLVWCILLGAVYLVIDSRLQPKVATAINATGEIVIPRSPNGHFYVAGRIAGQPVTFLVDTGASAVSVSAEVARRIGLPVGRPIAVATANGSTPAQEVTGQTVSIGGISIRSARIIVLPNLGNEALLGQNVLRHLDVTQTPEQMILRPQRN